jgi:hypothetical protein
MQTLIFLLDRGRPDMTERRVVGISDPLAQAEPLPAPRRSLLPFWRALAVAGLLVTALSPAAGLPAEAPPGASPATPAFAASLPAAGCDAQSMLADPGLTGASGATCVAPDLESDQAYLVETASPGTTMLRQGPAVAIVRLHPMFVHRLAAAIGEARIAGLPTAGIFSAYRPPVFGVGRFSDKYNSLHTYGLAVDMRGIGPPGSSEAKLWYEIAARHAIVCPYGADNRREWNHCQPTGVKSIMAGNPLRGTVSPRGPIDLEMMFAMGDGLVNGTDDGFGPPELSPVVDEESAPPNEAPPPPQRTTGRKESVATARERADRSPERHRPAKSTARSAPDPRGGEARGQPKRRIVAQHPSLKSGPVKKYRISSLAKRESSAAEIKPAPSKHTALARRIDEEHGRLDRAMKGICRGC